MNAKFCTQCGHQLQQGVHFCSQCGRQVNQEPELVNQQNEPQQASVSNEEIDWRLWEGVMELCQANPDKALEMLRWMLERSPDLESNPYYLVYRMQACHQKGLGRATDANPQVNLISASAEELCSELGLTNEQLDLLESVLHDANRIEELAPGIKDSLDEDNKRAFDGMRLRAVLALKRCRPGKVEEILKGTVSLPLLLSLEADAKLAYVSSMYETDPDRMLAAINSWIEEEPKIASTLTGLRLRYLRAQCFYDKAVPPAKRKGIVEEDAAWDRFITASGAEIRSLLGLTEEDLDYLEAALGEIRGLQADPNFESLAPDGEWVEALNGSIDGMAIPLERCRPGRVQEILGSLKLGYFEPGNVRKLPYGIAEDEGFRRLMWTSFKGPDKGTARTAAIFEQGTDTKGRKYLGAMLFGGTFDMLGPGEGIGELNQVGDIYLFDDGTSATSLDLETAEARPPLRSTDQAISPKSRTAVVLLVFFLGGFGIHRFYLGKIGTGILMLLTLGGLGFWTLINFLVAVSGNMKDKDGRVISRW